MQLQMDKEKEIAKYASEKNALIDEKAIGLLKDTDNYREIIDELLEEGHFIINEMETEKKH